MRRYASSLSSGWGGGGLFFVAAGGDRASRRDRGDERALSFLADEAVDQIKLGEQTPRCRESRRRAGNDRRAILRCREHCVTCSGTTQRGDNAGRPGVPLVRGNEDTVERTDIGPLSIAVDLGESDSPPSSKRIDQSNAFQCLDRFVEELVGSRVGHVERFGDVFRDVPGHVLAIAGESDVDDIGVSGDGFPSSGKWEKR